MLRGLGNIVYKAYGGKCPEQGRNCAVCLEPTSGRIVELHCSHTFCLQPCFVQLIDHDHTLCPLCCTPIVVLSPALDYLRISPMFTLDPDKTQRRFDRIDRLNQYRLIHDGDDSEARRRLHGGVPDDFLVQVRKACRTCKFKGAAHLRSEAFVQGSDFESVENAQMVEHLQTRTHVPGINFDEVAQDVEPESLGSMPSTDAIRRKAVVRDPESDEASVLSSSASTLPLAHDILTHVQTFEDGEHGCFLVTDEPRHHIPKSFLPVQTPCSKLRDTRDPRDGGSHLLTEEQEQLTPLFIPGVQDHVTMFRLSHDPDSETVSVPITAEGRQHTPISVLGLHKFHHEFRDVRSPLEGGNIQRSEAQPHNARIVQSSAQCRVRKAQESHRLAHEASPIISADQRQYTPMLVPRVGDLCDVQSLASPGQKGANQETPIERTHIVPMFMQNDEDPCTRF